MSARTPGHHRRPARERHLALIQGLPADLGCGAACLCPAVAGVPAGMLRALLAELNACGMRPAGMTLTRLRATFVFPTGLVACCCGTWLMWTTGRLSARGRPLYTLHSIADAAAAARRLAQRGPAVAALTSHHAQEEAIAMYVMPPAGEDALARMKALSAELTAAGVDNKLSQGSIIDVSVTITGPGGRETQLVVDEDGFVEVGYWTAPGATPAQVAAMARRILAVISERPT